MKRSLLHFAPGAVIAALLLASPAAALDGPQLPRTSSTPLLAEPGDSPRPVTRPDGRSGRPLGGGPADSLSRLELLLERLRLLVVRDLI